MNLLSHVACLPSVQMYTNNFHLKRRDSEIIQMYSHAMHDGKAYSHVLGKPHLWFGEYNTNIHRKTVGIPQSARIFFITPTMWRWFHKRSHRELLLACLSHAIYQYLHVRMSSFIGDLSAFKSILLLYNKIMYSIYWDPSGEDVLGIWVDFDLLILPTSHVEIVFVPKKKEKARRLSQFCCLGDMGI